MTGKNPVAAILVGTGGYASFYIKHILETDQTDVRLVGTVDPTTDGLDGTGIPHWKSLPKCLSNAESELVIISSPPMFHAEQIRQALETGRHVLCEKPLAPTPAPVADLAALRDRLGLQVGIGFQWSFSRPILDLKADILSGVFGAPLSAQAMVLWPRSFEYFQRNSWAGRITDDRGNPINDSVLFNATAHHFHNLTFLLGADVNRSAAVRDVRAETFRAYDIENFDTVALRGTTDSGVPLGYYASHAGEVRHSPVFRLAFEKGTVAMEEGENSGDVIATFADGTSKNYGNPETDRHRKITVMAAAVRGNAEVPCTLETVVPHLQTVEAVRENAPPRPFPAEFVQRDEKHLWVPGLDTDMRRCFENLALPGELQCPWACPNS